MLPLAQRLRSTPHRLLLSSVKERGEDWESGEAPLRPWTDLVQGLLEGHPTLLPLQLSREGNQCQGHQWRNGWVCQYSYWKWFKFCSGIQAYDIVSTLQYLGMIKYWRGKHVILRKEDVIADYMERVRSRPRDKVTKSLLMQVSLPLSHPCLCFWIWPCSFNQIILQEISPAHLKWKPYEPTAKEKRQAEQIKKKQEERQKAR